MDIPSTVNVRNDTCALLMDICRLFPLTLCSTSCNAKCMYIVLDLSTNELILSKDKRFLKNIKKYQQKSTPVIMYIIQQLYPYQIDS